MAYNSSSKPVIFGALIVDTHMIHHEMCRIFRIGSQISYAIHVRNMFIYVEITLNNFTEKCYNRSICSATHGKTNVSSVIFLFVCMYACFNRWLCFCPVPYCQPLPHWLIRTMVLFRVHQFAHKQNKYIICFESNTLWMDRVI